MQSSVTKEQFTFFWGGAFSQWARCRFVPNMKFSGRLEPITPVNQRTFNTAEQFMMAGKALIFQDQKRFEWIMASTDPRDQKDLGRQVENFDPEVWNSVARSIVYVGNFYKFRQNADLKRKLIATRGTTLVEASPKDKIWGIGLSSDDARAHDRTQWQGTNWLGEVLTKVRDDIIAKGL